jgi:hypothetical protein
MIAEPDRTDLGLQALISQFVSLTVKKRELKERLQEIEQELDRLNSPIIDGLLDAGIASQTVWSADGVRYTVAPRKQFWARPQLGGMQPLCDAMKAYGAPDLVREQINVMQLTAWVREHREQGLSIPAEVEAQLQITETPEIRVRRA